MDQKVAFNPPVDALYVAIIHRHGEQGAIAVTGQSP